MAKLKDIKASEVFRDLFKDYSVKVLMPDGTQIGEIKTKGVAIQKIKALIGFKIVVFGGWALGTSVVIDDGGSNMAQLEDYLRGWLATLSLFHIPKTRFQSSAARA